MTEQRGEDADAETERAVEALDDIAPPARFSSVLGRFLAPGEPWPAGTVVDDDDGAR